MITPRDYQVTALAKITQAEARGVRRPLVVHPTGSGKTVTFSHLIASRRGRSLVLVHRDELAHQTVAKLALIAPELSVGIVKAERDEHDRDVVVASVQTAHRDNRLARLSGFATVIVDECFPAGTEVGGKPIESICVGDVIPSYDERTGHILPRTVTHTWRRPAAALVRVEISGRAPLVCTPNHPLLTPEGWTPAGQLFPGQEIGIADGGLHVVWNFNRSCHHQPEKTVEEGSSVLLAGVSGRLGFTSRRSADGSSYEATAAGDSGVRVVCDRNRGSYQEPQKHAPSDRSNLLLAGVSGRLGQSGQLETDGPHQPVTCVSPNATEESDAFGRGQRTYGRDAALDRPPPTTSRWQRSRSNGAAAPPSARIGLADRSDRSNQDAPWRWVSHPLQNRYRSSRPSDCDRSGRVHTPLTGGTSAGCQERRVPQWARVDRVAVLQPGRNGTFGGLCPDGQVYNLEVDGTHTYLANGVVAHNCHHASAPTWKKVLTGVGAFADTGPLTVGFTATPEREGSKLGVWQEVVDYRSIREMIYAGYLSPVSGQTIETSADFANVKVSRGDFSETGLGDALEDSGALDEIAAAYQKYAPERKGVAFLPTVATARGLAEALNARGIASEAVWGAQPMDERRAVLRRLSRGETRCVSNCGVLSEGFDEPSVDCIVVARPTRSHALYIQQVGRGLRKHPGKSDCLILDVVGATERHDLVALIDLGLDAVATRKKPGEAGESVLGSRCELCGRELSATLVMEGARRHDNCRARGTARVDVFATSRLRWLPVHDDGVEGFVLPCGKEVVVMVPAAGREDAWTLATYLAGRLEILHAALPVDWASGIGEDRAKAFGPLAERNARWLSESPTERQLSRLVRDGLAPQRLGAVKTRGQAADLLTRIQGRRAIRKLGRTGA